MVPTMPKIPSTVPMPEDETNPDLLLTEEDLGPNFFSRESQRESSWLPPAQAQVHKELDEAGVAKLEALASRPETTAAQLQK